MSVSALVDKCSATKKIADFLGLQAHPWLRSVRNGLKSAQTHAVVSLLSKIIYRCDPGTQYTSWEAPLDLSLSFAFFGSGALEG